MRNYSKLYILEKRLQRLERTLDLKLEKVVKGVENMPKYFYHGTSSDRALNILKTGLLPNTENKNHNLSYDGVFMTLTLDSAKEWAKSLNNSLGYTVLKIDSSYLNPDLLNYDANALAANDMFDSDSDGFDDLDLDGLDNLEVHEMVTFPNNLEIVDFVYDGKIPPKAISVAWESAVTSKTAVEAAELIYNNDFKSLFNHWDKYKDLTYQDKTIPYLVYLELSSQYDGRLWEWNNCAKVLKKIPGKALSYFDKDGESLLSLVTYDTRIYDNNSAKVLKELSYRDDVSDEAIEHIWSQYSKPKQTKDLSDLKDLPDRILLLGKPYIAKKNWKILGI